MLERRAVFGPAVALRSDILASLGGAFHVSYRALWPDSSEQCARRQSSSARNQEGHDREAPQTDRAGCQEKSARALSARTFLRTLFLRGAKYSLVRTD